MPSAVDGTQAGFFRFVDRYHALISRHIPGTYNFEYDSRLYMLPVHRHLEMVVAATPAGGRVLEPGCGRGHYCAYLNQRGLQAEGYEVTDPAPGDDFLHNQDKSAITRYPALWAEAKADYGCD